MIPVEQRELYDPENGGVGDCWKCCIASILELGYDEVPHFVRLEDEGIVPSYWNATQEWLGERGLVLASFGPLWGTGDPLLKIGQTDIAYFFTAPGHWIAGVRSPRVGADGKHLLHAVVMQGSRIVWDPHPQRADGHLGFVDANLLAHV